MHFWGWKKHGRMLLPQLVCYPCSCLEVKPLCAACVLAGCDRVCYIRVGKGTDTQKTFIVKIPKVVCQRNEPDTSGCWLRCNNHKGCNQNRP
ncbi:hypothetical protein DFH08DRAFT_852895 [Mycena albidolilacea]|uniref:Secreted protein n=1 Tax=Mycena albidolilacea TaxID=1033008 RepID=A0AAD7EZ35_9AGAR|nr:hypothetical protein DFH08DRAFT_852895 [Mycena albidolilacea]